MKPGRPALTVLVRGTDQPLRQPIYGGVSGLWTAREDAMIRRTLQLLLVPLGLAALAAWPASYWFPRSRGRDGASPEGFDKPNPQLGGYETRIVLAGGVFTAWFTDLRTLHANRQEWHLAWGRLGVHRFGRSCCAIGIRPGGASPDDPTACPNHSWAPIHFATCGASLLLWFPAGLFVAYPALTFVRRPLRRYRRRRKRLCLKCGYNLTGNVTGVCPECARPTPTNPAARRFVQEAYRVGSATQKAIPVPPNGQLSDLGRAIRRALFRPDGSLYSEG